MLCQNPLQSIETESQASGKFGIKSCTFTRGISCVDNMILAGTHTGEIAVIVCTSESNFQQKKSIRVGFSVLLQLASSDTMNMNSVSGACSSSHRHSHVQF
jgi:hypothetical protein